MNHNPPNDRGNVARLHGAVAVTALARSVRNVRITLSPPRTTPMAVVVAEHPPTPNRADLVSRLMMELAGTEAVRLFHGTEPDGVPSSALTLVEQLRSDGDERPAPTILQESRDEVARILNVNRPLVELLGDVLLREGVLEGATMQQIVGDHLIS